MRGCLPTMSRVARLCLSRSRANARSTALPFFRSPVPAHEQEPRNDAIPLSRRIDGVVSTDTDDADLLHRHRAVVDGRLCGPPCRETAHVGRFIGPALRVEAICDLTLGQRPPFRISEVQRLDELSYLHRSPLDDRPVGSIPSRSGSGPPALQPLGPPDAQPCCRSSPSWVCSGPRPD